MKTAQYKWSQSDGWRPNLPTGEVGRQSVVFVFGARSLMQAGDLVGELRDHFKEAAMLGCSTSGEILGDTVVDDSVTATIVDFEHTRLRSASATIGEAKASYDVGKELAIYRAHKAAPVVIATDGETRLRSALETISVPAVHPTLAFVVAGVVFFVLAAIVAK